MVAMKNKMYIDKLLKITWWDIASENGWVARDEALNLDPVLCTSVGYCIDQNDKKLVLAATLQNQEVSEVTTLPIGVIESIVILVEEKV